MVYNLRLVRIKDRCNPCPIGNVRYVRKYPRTQTADEYFTLDLKERTLGLVDEYQEGGLITDHLADQLVADRTRRTGDTDAHSAHLIGYVDVVEMYRLPLQEVLDFDILDLGDTKLTVN